MIEKMSNGVVELRHGQHALEDALEAMCTAPKHKKKLLINMICYTNLQLAGSENPQRLKAAASLVYSDVHEKLKDVQAWIKRENMILEKSTRNRLEFATRGHAKNTNIPSLVSPVNSAPVLPNRTTVPRHFCSFQKPRGGRKNQPLTRAASTST